MGKELPPEIPRPYLFSLSLDAEHQTEDLVSPYRPFHLGLAVSHQIESLFSYFQDPVHDKLPRIPLKKHHISPAQLPVRLPEINIIPGMY